MLFTESQLQMNGNPMAVLNEATYLDEDEAIIRPQTIPVAENTRIGAYTVRFDDVHRLAENHGADYIDAVVAIAESSGIDPAYLKVAVDEAEIICNPDVVFALPENGVVVSPLSENSLAFQYVTECINLWNGMPDTDESDMALAEALVDDTYLEQFLNEAEAQQNNERTLWDKTKDLAASAKSRLDYGIHAAANATGASKFADDFKRARGRAAFDQLIDSDDPKGTWSTVKSNAIGLGHAVNQNKLFTAGVVGGAALAGYGLKKAYNWLTQADKKPKTWIGQKIAALRKVYASWMQKAQKGGPGVGDKIKQAAAKLLSIIDALMEKMQHAAG